MTLTFTRTSLSFRTEFPIAGARCLLSTNSARVLRLAIPWQDGAEGHTPTQSFEMEIIEQSVPYARDETLPHFRGIRHLVFAMFEPRSFWNFDLLRRRVMGVVSSAAARDQFFWNTQLLPITVGILGTTLDIAPLHCACLDKDGSGLLIAGTSGAGKSTLTAALAKRGFAVVSDDWTYLSSEHSTLIAHGLSAPIKLLPDAVRHFEELHKCTPRKTLNGELAYEIDPVKTFRSSARAISHPRWILFLERTSAPGCRFLPCRPDHVKQFFEKHAEKLPPELPEARAARSGIIYRLSSCESWILHTGADPKQTAEEIDRFLREV
jgi:hypothetical protein